MLFADEIREIPKDAKPSARPGASTSPGKEIEIPDDPETPEPAADLMAARG